MADDTRLEIDHQALGMWLRTSPELRRVLEQYGTAAVTYAKSIAPVGQAPKDRHPGAYRDGMTSEIHQGKTRMSVRIGSRDQKASWIEFGARHMPKYAVLRRTLDYLRGALR